MDATPLDLAEGRGFGVDHANQIDLRDLPNELHHPIRQNGRILDQ
jgi:hypothetical protein